MEVSYNPEIQATYNTIVTSFYSKLSKCHFNIMIFAQKAIIINFQKSKCAKSFVICSIYRKFAAIYNKV